MKTTMTKEQLIALAQKNGVRIVYFYRWCADIDGTTKELIRDDKISNVIKFLLDNNIKINN